MSRNLEHDVNYKNPMAGKGGMFWGKTSRILGYITAGTGVVGWITNYVAPNIQANSDVERIFQVLERSYTPLLGSGGGLVLAGIILGAVGKAKHWWANKDYYRN